MALRVLAWMYQNTPSFIAKPVTIGTVFVGAAFLWVAIFGGRLVTHGFRALRRRTQSVRLK